MDAAPWVCSCVEKCHQYIDRGSMYKCKCGGLVLVAGLSTQMSCSSQYFGASEKEPQ